MSIFSRAACHGSVDGFSGNRYEGFYSVAAAEEAWLHARAAGNTGSIPEPVVSPPSPPEPLDDEQVYWVIVKGASPGVYHGK